MAEREVRWQGVSRHRLDYVVPPVSDIATIRSISGSSSRTPMRFRPRNDAAPVNATTRPRRGSSFTGPSGEEGRGARPVGVGRGALVAALPGVPGAAFGAFAAGGLAFACAAVVGVRNTLICRPGQGAS